MIFPKVEKRISSIRANTRTDLGKWKLKIDNGRQWWEYVRQEKQNDIEKYWTQNVKKEEGFELLKILQNEEGFWSAEYGGPQFLIPGLVITWYITGCREDILGFWSRVEMLSYLRNTARENGWGLHTQEEATLFGTVMNYIAMRILGADESENIMIKAREFIWEKGALNTPLWGKFWMSVLGVYEWEGVPVLSPEMWILPTFLPFHPSKMWLHSRNVCMGMSYLYGIRATCEVDALIYSLRRELYGSDFSYSTFEWSKARKLFCQDYTPVSWLSRMVDDVLYFYESIHNLNLRKTATSHLFELCRNEDINTDYLCLGPVNKVINMLVSFCSGTPQEFEKHAEKVKDFLFITPDGMLMNGTNGSQVWDAALISLMLVESGKQEYRELMLNSLKFLESQQITDNPPLFCYRNPTKGSFPFSTKTQGYTVSDCTAHGMQAIIKLKEALGIVLDYKQFLPTINLLLSMQNKDDGFASYEKIRGSPWLEKLNNSQIFSKIIVEYSYPECTSSVIVGLCSYLHAFDVPEILKVQIQNSINRGVKYIASVQNSDGSWYGNWGVCFTYAAWHCVEALCDAGYSESETVKKACLFLVQNQNGDGGWGEDRESCLQKKYVSCASKTVNTSWAVLALLKAKSQHQEAIARGVKFLQVKKTSLDETVGVFNATCLIRYTLYSLYFPLWALSRNQ